MADAAAEEVGVMEAVVTAESLVDRSPAQLGLRVRYGVNLLALSRRGERIEQRPRSLKFRAGDVIALQGNLDFLPDVLGELRCLPLAERGVPLGRDRRRVIPLVVLAVTIALVSLDLVPLAVAFFGAAVVLLLLRVLSLRKAYEAVEWPIIILLGALIPVSEAVRETGGTELFAFWLAQAAAACRRSAASH